MDWPLQRHGDAGRSAQREYRPLRKAWEKRVFGRVLTWFWPALVVLVLASAFLLQPARTPAMVTLLVAGFAWVALRDACTPDHIQRWQRGAWGERAVAKRLRPLEREGWVVRHDLRVGRGNRDHVVVGNGVYLLDTKFLPHDAVTVEVDALRVRRVDQPRDSYVLDRLPRWMRGAAKSLSSEIREATGERVFVQPVVVVHGGLDPAVQEAGGVVYVESDALADWLRRRADRLDQRRRIAVSDWLRTR